MNRLVFEQQGRLSDLGDIAQAILKLLLEAKPFCAFIEAPMGSGKTTLVSRMLRGYGLDERTPVVSPTYTLVNDYAIGDQWFAHMDFYRAGPGFSLAELGVLDVRPYRGYFVEWPEVAPGDENFEPTHLIRIAWIDENTRSFSVFLPSFAGS